jgi:hypothetical protein
MALSTTRAPGVRKAKHHPRPTRHGPQVRVHAVIRHASKTRVYAQGKDPPPIPRGARRVGYVTPHTLKVEPLLEELGAHNLKVMALLRVRQKPLLKEVAILKVLKPLSPSSTPRTRGSSMTVCCIGFASQVTVLTARSLSPSPSPRPCPRKGRHGGCPVLSSEDVFQETSARYRAVEPEQWLRRHPEAGSSWPSWPKASGSFVSLAETVLNPKP